MESWIQRAPERRHIRHIHRIGFREIRAANPERRFSAFAISPNPDPEPGIYPVSFLILSIRRATVQAPRFSPLRVLGLIVRCSCS